MGDFTVYPAIDLRNGQVVRLRQGRADQQQTYSGDPVEVGREWVRQGAQWLHVVNLDGAFGENTPENGKAIRDILAALYGKVQIQFGGGIRAIRQIRDLLAMGVSRVVLGTAVLENPEFAAKALEAYPADLLAFGLDARGDELMIRGWQTASGKRTGELAQELAGLGAKTLIYTNILKDGMQSGVDWSAAQKLAKESGLRVIASGGTAALSDISAVRQAGLAGVIVGKALYEGSFSLKEALNVR
ncbi:1-(5-phosphoribosyl)-5-[(5-phosphoribosylamino)methylideneamino]imidazole-4-carboxamide isomerase [Pelolinea submarina]|uniref:1-(5-phosphoribosyl)-5-[(5-phosphoribosylamino)methylideneamino] imidazole-4-carboxamide isomerase n=1 Tax=Pelolinea submarina TaxID=913107 RepID=A0A347ZTW2_9CHLR|nr:1-(5-phosphoribosyl)-5-[(5-phosphoribosylamino)methylideneamino]imidazole-4-carboxamide isomerase [Pelolinea submarina]REG10674.1 1-(5-phosphoribosyl)-5-[(5-phosphoribosylamino)methylideneamino] imidazole-4-carboxamide isomerase [Pelolinea submarina]BBB48743.1 phosphoribosylformimino-5-aminoimidazole carboxamide ribotide isomerase [Pelolinea submarina]